MKTHFKLLKNPNYVGSWDLYDSEGNLKELTVTIAGAVKEMVFDGNGKQEECSVIKFKEIKPMVANATNLKMISKITGTPFIEEWVGKKITLVVKKVRAFGEMHDAIRVKDEVPTLPVLNETHPHWEKIKQALKNKSATIDQVKANYQITEILLNKLQND